MPIPFEDLDITEQAKAIAQDYFRGYNQKALAKKYGCPLPYIKTIVDFIEDREERLSDFDQYLADTKQRTIEEIRICDEQISLLWEDIEYCRQRMPVLDKEGDPQFETDPKTGAYTGVMKTVMRDPNNYAKLMKLLTEVSDRKAELLLLNGQKVDIAIKLQMAVNTQNILLNAIRELPPEQYEMVHRHLAAVTEGTDMFALPSGDVIDVPHHEVRHATS